jgi:hypothetical protein
MTLPGANWSPSGNRPHVFLRFHSHRGASLFVPVELQRTRKGCCKLPCSKSRKSDLESCSGTRPGARTCPEPSAIGQ